MKEESQKKYRSSDKGKAAIIRARKKYDEKDPSKRKEQKREYMRRMRKKDPNKWR
tara:strand:- start:59 stop:223 length:165 start_codon:yes stop_codon:yes gene_type:complete